MRLKVLHTGGWRVAAVLNADDRCLLEEELVSLADNPKLYGYILGFHALWARIQRVGPRALGTDLYHCVDEEHEIYEFLKGPLRLLCFEAEGAVVVCSHVIRKQRQKIKARDKQQAIALRRDFLQAQAARNVIYETDI